MIRRLLGLVTAVALLAGIAWSSEVGPEVIVVPSPVGAAVAAAGVPARTALLEEEFLACPQPPATGAVPVASVVGVAVPEARDGAVPEARDGVLSAEVLPLEGGEALASLDGPGLVAVAAPDGNASAVLATGPGAPAVVASLTTLVPSGEDRGYSTLSCPAARSEAWFVGSGSQIGRRGRLVLLNPTASAAVVDVELSGPDGALTAAAATGVTVPSGDSRELLLDGLVPDQEVFGIHVLARQGRVAAAVSDREVSGLDVLGVDWVPEADAPARRVVVPAVPGVPVGVSTRTLHVLVPGDADAVVRVRVLAADGPLEVADLDVLPLAAGTVSSIELPVLSQDRPVALEIISDVPVTAGVAVRRGEGGEGGDGEDGEGLTDLSWTAAVRPRAEQVTSPLLLASAADVQLVVTAPGDAVEVEVVALVPGAAPAAPVTLEVAAGATGSLDVAALLGGADGSVVVRPAGTRAVFAAGTTSLAPATGSALLALAPLRARGLVVDVPAVAPDLRAGVRTR